MEMSHKLTLIVLMVQFVWLLSACREGATGSVRPSALAGSWYPGDAKELAQMVDGFLAKATIPAVQGKVVALISPHAGYAWSGLAAAHGYKLIHKGDYDVVVIMAPSHTTAFHGASILDVDYYSTPLGRIPLARDICDKLRENPLIGCRPEAHYTEHSVEIQLPFLQRRLEEFQLVPIVMGDMRPDEMREVGQAIQAAVAGRRVLFVASSDFTHYGFRFGYLPFTNDQKNKLKALDMGAVERIVDKDFDGFIEYKKRTGITVCGWIPISTLLSMAGKDWTPKLLTYYTSGDLSHDWSNSVSYVSLAFTSVSAARQKPAKQEKANGPEPLTAAEKATLLKLARATLESYVREGKRPSVNEKEYPLTPALKAKCGVFVTLKKHGRLRGCIGHIMGRLPLYEGVIENAINAAAEDPRFPPVRPDELKDIDIEVSVLTPFREVSGPQDFIPGKHGIYIQKGFRSAVFLPQVATEQGWDRAETLRHLCMKAGLPPDEWKRPGMRFHVCEGIHFGEKDE